MCGPSLVTDARRDQGKVPVGIKDMVALKPQAVTTEMHRA